MHASLHWLRVEEKLTAALYLSTWRGLQMKTPEDWYNQFINSLPSHGYATRQVAQGKLNLPAGKRNFIDKSVIYRAIKAWNELPPDIKNLTNKYSFKKKLKSYLGRAYL